MNNSESLCLRDVSFGYGGSPVVRDVALAVVAGECVALMGPSGCGKSTLLLLAAGVLVPDSGEVMVEGRSLRAASEFRAAVRRDRIGLVFQFGELVAELSLLDNVALAAELAGVRRREAARAAEEMLVRVGLDGLSKRLPSQVSGGQAQRTAVARAMVNRPALVLADEPTGALDSTTAQGVLELLLESAKDLGAAVLIATHDERVAAQCDRVVRMSDGRTVAPSGAEAGTPRIPMTAR